MATNSTSRQDAGVTLPDSNLGDCLVIEIECGNIYLAAFDKKASKSILLLNKHDQIATPTTVAFVDDEVLVGESAARRIVTNAENTFRHLDQLLGEPFEDEVIQSYAKGEKHVVVQQNHRCLLRIPSRNKYMSAEKLIALIIAQTARFAATKYNHTFQSISWAFSFMDSSSERMIRARAEAARLAGFEDVRFHPRAAGLVNHTLYDCPCYLQPKPGPLRFIVVEASDSCYRVNVVVVDAGITSLEKCPIHKSRSTSCFYFLDKTLRCLDACNGFQVVAVLVTVPSSYNASHRSTTVSGLRDFLQQRSRQLEVQDIESPGAACRGIVYGSNQGSTRHAIVGRPFYSVLMAVTESTTHPDNIVQLFGPHDDLPCQKDMTLIQSHLDRTAFYCASLLGTAPLQV